MQGKYYIIDVRQINAPTNLTWHTCILLTAENLWKSNIVVKIFKRKTTCVGKEIHLCTTIVLISHYVLLRIVIFIYPPERVLLR